MPITVPDSSFEQSPSATDSTMFASAWGPQQPGGDALAFVARAGSTFLGSLAIPDGLQVAGVRGQGAFVNQFAGDGGRYTLNIVAAQAVKNDHVQDLAIVVNGVQVDQFTPGASFAQRVTPAFTYPATQSSGDTSYVAIKGLNTAGGNNAALFDLVTLVAAPTDPVVPPSIGAITVSSDGATDTIPEPTITPGTYPIASAWLFVGTTAGGESSTPAATKSAPPFSFTHATASTGTNYYVVKLLDTQGNASAPSNEVHVDAPSQSTAATVAQVSSIVNSIVTNAVSLVDANFRAVMTPARLAIFDAIPGELAAVAATLGTIQARVNQIPASNPTAPLTTADGDLVAGRLLALVGALEPGRTLKQSFRKILASAAGSIDDTSEPDALIFRLSDQTEAFRVPATGRTSVIEGANL